MAGGLGQVSDELESFEDINRELEPSSIDYVTGAFAPVVLSAGLNTVLIRFTEEQYKWLLSSAMTGAFIIYPENPLNAIFPLLECLDMPISNCSQVAACIESSQEVKDALSDWFRDTEYNEALERALRELSESITGYNGSDTCNEDELFGAATAVFDELNQSAIDWLEILEASSQVLELLSEWGEELAALAIASSGTLAVAVAVAAVFATVVEQFILDLIQNYQASYTTELRDELRCEFFCYAMDNDCSFTAFSILEWLEPQIDFFAQTLPDLVAWFFGLTIDVSRQTVLRMWYFELALYRFAITNSLASIFVSVPARNALVRLSRVAQAAPADDTWDIICEPCGPSTWTQVFDFTAAALFRPFNNDANRAQWISGSGWRRRLNAPLNGTRLMIESISLSGANITEIETEFSSSITLNPNGGVYNTPLGSKGGTLSSTELMTGSVTVNGRILIQILNSPPNQFPSSAQLPATFYIKKVTIRGTGVNPFI